MPSKFERLPKQDPHTLISWNTQIIERARIGGDIWIPSMKRILMQ